jgi:hypothetical protein
MDPAGDAEPSNVKVWQWRLALKPSDNLCKELDVEWMGICNVKVQLGLVRPDGTSRSASSYGNSRKAGAHKQGRGMSSTVTLLCCTESIRAC